MHPNSNTILIPNLSGIYVIDISSIIRIEAVSSYSKIYLSDGKKIVVSKVLRQMEEMLAGKGFARIHRSHLVNTAWIQAYHLHQLKITLNNNEQVCISRRKSSVIRKTLSDQRAAWLNQQRMQLTA
jgi:two-component system, LytTR family, response regulator